MAKNNKYTSINFNHIYEKSTTTTTNSNTHLAKTLSPSSSSFASYSAISAPNKSHGRMLVLTRSTPKPLQPPQQPKPSQQTQQLQDHRPRSEPGPDAISLRPLGRTGTGSSLSSSALNHDKDKEVVISPKPDKFVPPHLRPGFVPKEEKPGPEFGRPGRSAENGRPKSSGYERMRRGGVSDVRMMNRPRSSGCRPNSSG